MSLNLVYKKGLHIEIQSAYNEHIHIYLNVVKKFKIIRLGYHERQMRLGKRSRATSVGDEKNNEWNGRIIQGWYHTVRVPFGIDTIQYSGVLYGIA